jgi:hypothetical protein
MCQRTRRHSRSRLPYRAKTIARATINSSWSMAHTQRAIQHLHQALGILIHQSIRATQTSTTTLRLWVRGVGSTSKESASSCPTPIKTNGSRIKTVIGIGRHTGGLGSRMIRGDGSRITMDTGATTIHMDGFGRRFMIADGLRLPCRGGTPNAELVGIPITLLMTAPIVATLRRQVTTMASGLAIAPVLLREIAGAARMSITGHSCTRISMR